MKKTLLAAAIALAAATCTVGMASAQVAGSTTRDATLTEVHEIALGWSVKKSILGKTVYAESGAKVGTVVDLIITPDKVVSYLIIGAGGFIGMGRHDVAIPVSQVRDLAGKLIMAGATPDTIKGMPAFNYANDEARQAQFVAAADRDIARARDKLADLQKKATAASAEAKLKFDAQSAALERELPAAEAKLAELRRAGAASWRAFETDVSAAMAKLRKAIDAAVA